MEEPVIIRKSSGELQLVFPLAVFIASNLLTPFILIKAKTFEKERVTPLFIGTPINFQKLKKQKIKSKKLNSKGFKSKEQKDKKQISKKQKSKKQKLN